MKPEQSVVDEAAVEQLIGQIRGVLAVRVVADGQGQIDEVHVVGTPERSAKAMVRDVESILYVRGGVRVDHRKISLVQIAETTIQPLLPRVALLDVAQSGEDELSGMLVTLGMGELRVQGAGRARPGHPAAPAWLAGYATTHALDQLIGGRGQFHLENVQRRDFGALPVYLAHLTLTTDEGMEMLLGISVLRDDEPAAVARAILDAVNRRLQRLLGETRTAAH